MNWAELAYPSSNLARYLSILLRATFNSGVSVFDGSYMLAQWAVPVI